jgi:hypothetical protein
MPDLNQPLSGRAVGNNCGSLLPLLVRQLAAVVLRQGVATRKQRLPQREQAPWAKVEASFRTPKTRRVLAALLLLTATSQSGASPNVDPAGVVSHIKVLSDKVEDVSSMEAWKGSVIKPGMTEQEKALAVWESVVKFRQQDSPPNEYLQSEENVHDPIKTFNVYGYGMCCCASANIAALGRYAGLPARGRIINAHSVPELFWGGGWHLLDASLIQYVPKPDGTLAGVDEIMAGVQAWYGQHPELKGNDAALRTFMRGGGWKNGPEILRNSPFYDNNGWLPAATHGWYSTMQEYDGSANGFYEYGYSQGYQVNVQLRPGERLTRNWSNKGLHINAAEGGGVYCLNGAVGKDDLRYAPRYGDLAPGRIGNGTLAWDVPLDDRTLRAAALTVENLAGAGEGDRRSGLRLRDPARPGVLILRVPSSYVFLGGEVALKPLPGTGGRIELFLSDNNGLDWKPLTTVATGGEQRVDLKPHIYRRYDYRLKLVMRGPDAGLERLRLSHDVQHSQRALPALGQGRNQVTFSAGPPEGTITIEGSLNPKARGKQLVYTDFHPRQSGVQDPWLAVTSTEGQITFPITTPGDMVRLRLGGHYRARAAEDGWSMQVSFDNGKTFRTIGRLAGPTTGNSHYLTFADIPPGTRTALVRWTGTRRDTICLFSLRIDADYREPHGGFEPVQVTYVWEEEGVEKRHVHIATQPEERYTIDCGTRPVMKSLVVERVGSVPSRTAAAGPGTTAAPRSPSLRDALLRRVQRDQDARFEWIKDMRNRQLAARVEAVDRENTAWMRAIVKRHGWPSRAQVGKEGVQAAFLLVQHADAARDFQKQCLPLIRKAADRGEVPKEAVAMLTDRLLAAEGKKQRYGSYFIRNAEGEWIPHPIEDEARVDERRRSMGMVPLAEYAKGLRELYGSQKERGEESERGATPR